MRFFTFLLIASLFFCIAINFSVDLHYGQDVVSRAAAPFEVKALKTKYGGDRNFSHSETRGLYHTILKQIGEHVARMTADFDDHERAMVCSVMRANARKYARERDTLSVGAFFLQLRDSYVHAVRYLPLSIRKDFKRTCNTGKPTFHTTAITVKQAFVCLAPYLTRGECPSYTFLKEVRGKSDDDILTTCTLSNKGYDAAYGG